MWSDFLILLIFQNNKPAGTNAEGTVERNFLEKAAYES
jgi:hypothetical protein